MQSKLSNVLYNLVEYIDRGALTYNFGPTVADCPVYILLVKYKRKI